MAECFRLVLIGKMATGKKKIMIVAGEASGDLHGSRVVAALTRLNPELHVYGVGSERLRRAGAEMIADSSELSVVGITEVFARMGNLLEAYWKVKKFIQRSGLSLLILIDFPDFNLLLARAANGVGVPILYYISPQVWAWRSGRVKTIARRVKKIAVIFSFEVSIYKNAGLDVEFVGHPLLDLLGSNQQDLYIHEKMEGDPLVALLPGSRPGEVQRLLPEMVQAAKILTAAKPGARFILPMAPTVKVQELEKFLPHDSVPISVVEGKTYEALMAADLAVVASGTATLETAILGKPMVIAYRVSPLSYWVGRAMVKVDWVGLVNIVAGRKVVPELLQGEARGERIAAEVLRILDDEPYRKEMLGGLAEVREKLGTPGAAERVARMALEMIRNKG